MKTFPPRLHVLLARNAPAGLIFRRGPSGQVATFGWDRETDTFTLGQWLKGRIYERRSDLSPDGTRLIYFAMNGKWGSETRGSWTAISRAPYLKAESLFAKGDCWQGGGLFCDNRRYWLNGAECHTTIRDASRLRRSANPPVAGAFGWECPGVYYPRLLLHGWRLVERRETSSHKSYNLFEKPVTAGWALLKIAHAGIDQPEGKGCYWDEHALVHVGTGNRIQFEDWEWADVDRGRLVWAARGKLFAGELSKAGIAAQTELRDFTEDAFEAVKAPY